MNGKKIKTETKEQIKDTKKEIDKLIKENKDLFFLI